jgi:hypothetical protein
VLPILVGVCGASTEQTDELSWEAYPIIVGMDLVLVASALLTHPLRPRP